MTSSYHLTLDDFQFDSEHSGNRTRNIFVCSIHNISKFVFDKSTNCDATFGLIVELFGLFVEAFVLDIEIFGLFVETFVLDIEIIGLFGIEIVTFGLLVEIFGLIDQTVGLEFETFGLFGETFGLNYQNDQTFCLKIETIEMKIATVEKIWKFVFVDPDDKFDKSYFD